MLGREIGWVALFVCAGSVAVADCDTAAQKMYELSPYAAPVYGVQSGADIAAHDQRYKIALQAFEIGSQQFQAKPHFLEWAEFTVNAEVLIACYEDARANVATLPEIIELEAKYPVETRMPIVDAAKAALGAN